MDYYNTKKSDPEIAKALFALIFLIVLIFGVLFIANSKQKGNSRIEDITLNHSQMTVNIGETGTLTVELTPKDAKSKIEWISSNPNVATVSNGEVKGISVGSAIITAKVNNQVKAECVVFVDGINQGVGPSEESASVLPDSITLDKTNLSIKIDETYNLIATITPTLVSDDSIIWKSSDESIVTVYNGEIRGIKVGNATITATTSNGKVASCEVNVLPVTVESLAFESNNESITVGGTVQLIVKITPLNASNKEISWHSSDDSVATVNHGLVTGKKIGKATISAALDGKKVNATVTVVAKGIPIKSISISPNSASTSLGKAVSLTVKINPSNATNKNVTWSSSNTSIATVNSNGVVTPKKAGTVTITAKAGGKSATAKINISSVKVTGVTLNKTNLNLSVGDTATLTATVSPSNAQNKGVTWSSTATGIATVDQNGKVTAKSAGTASIIVRTNDGGYAKSATVKVTNNKATGISLALPNGTLAAGSTMTAIVTISPKEAANRPVTWSSSNSGIATVSNGGVIRGIKAGTSRITATVDGHSASITVQVIEIAATGISVSGTKNEFYTNYNIAGDLKTKLTATITPSNATNKSVTWTSSDTNIATVDSSGNVTVKKGTGVGPVTITAKTHNGKTATYSITVKKKILAVITASQGNRMNNVVSSYTNSSLNMNFTKADKSLYFIARSGSGICFQAGIKSQANFDSLGGFNCRDNDQNGSNSLSDITKTQTGNTYMIQELNKYYSSVKTYVEPIIIYTMPGNSLRSLTCDEMTLSRYTTLASAYGNAAKYYKDTKGYTKTKVYMVSHFPVNSTMAKAYYEANNTATSSRKVVSSGNSNKCNASYISAYKYYNSGRVFKSAISNSGAKITYVNVFAKFLQIKDSTAKTMQWNPDRPFSFKIEDSQHMDPETSEKYAKYMFDRVLAA